MGMTNGNERISESRRGYEFLKRFQEEQKGENASFNVFSDYLIAKAWEQNVPIIGQFELTPLCNFDCRMCYVHLTKDQMKEEILQPDQWKALMYQAWEAGMIKVFLTGGECLTYPGFEEIYLYLHSLGCEVYLLTNGSLLNDARIDFLKKHRPGNIQITLYGQNDDVYERVTGQRAFNQVKDAIRQLTDAGIAVRISITPSKYLGEDLLETVRTARKLSSWVDINPSLSIPREETGRSSQEHEADLDLYCRAYRLLRELNGKTVEEYPDVPLPEPGGPCNGEVRKGILCKGGRCDFVIDWKGSLYPCNRLLMIKAEPLNIGFRQAWQTINQQVLNWIREPACSGCPYETVCSPCAANVHRYSQPGGRPEEWCKRTVYFVRRGIYDIIKCN